MVVIENNLILKQIGVAEWDDVARLIHSDAPVHRHLGWRSPLDWLGHQPFLGAYRGEDTVGCLACPPNEDRVTWLRLLAVAEGEAVGDMWRRLWTAARESLRERRDITSVNVLAMHTWVQDLMQGCAFRKTYEVVVMEWDAERAQYPGVSGGVEIRPMKQGEIPDVYEVDSAAFDPLWRNSLQGLRSAHEVARIASVAVKGEGVVGYQISTADSLGGHLARLAVHPAHQNERVGTALVSHMLRKFERQGVIRVSVNTQKANVASIKLYQKFGFWIKDEAFPVYQYFF